MMLEYHKWIHLNIINIKVQITRGCLIKSALSQIQTVSSQTSHTPSSSPFDLFTDLPVSVVSRFLLGPLPFVTTLLVAILLLVGLPPNSLSWSCISLSISESDWLPWSESSDSRRSSSSAAVRIESVWLLLASLLGLKVKWMINKD